MFDIKEYKKTDTIYLGRTSAIYRGVKLTDNRPVILKTHRSDQPSNFELAMLQHEYQLLKQIDTPIIIQAHELIKYQHQLILVLEDIGAQSLRQYLQDHPIADLNFFFTLAIQMVKALSILHHHNIIHKDINPDNFIIEPRSANVQIIDLGIASALPQNTQETIQVQNLEGTLAYIAPEQTGRMSLNIDTRADLYSLGITFYEMLTGSLPFQSKDPLELVYCHLAKLPPPPSTLNPQIPPILDNIIAKLLAKRPEERYFTALGLEKDLQACQEQWQSKRAITNFPLGQYDISDRLIISQKLYGREGQIKQLLHTFEYVNQGHKKLLFISGYSGIGKTSLVKQIYEPITRQRGYFVSGKYDQLQRTIPYNAFIQAFQELIRLLLAEPEERLLVLKRDLQKAVGFTGKVIIDVIPNAQLLLGEQPPVPPLLPEEAQNRFMLTFQNFIRALAQPEHPLVVFLDDLQWADSASLKLLNLILSDPGLSHILIIAAYRDNELTKNHPLAIAQQQLHQTGILFDYIYLKPLTETDIQCYLADTLNSDFKQVQPLAYLLFAKTHGNPYFLNQLMKKLYQDKMLVFSHEKACWQWEIEDIAKVEITDNVIDLLTTRIRQLPNKTQLYLQFAACIGYKFKLNTLITIATSSFSEVNHCLLRAIQDELIQPEGQAARLAVGLDDETFLSLQDDIVYRFTHDRIQQSIYQLMDQEQRQAAHLKIARLSIQDQGLQEQDDRLFDIVNHFNQALPLITDRAERLRIAQANLWAGKRAKASTAYIIADTYFENGINLLPKDAWQAQYELTLALHMEAVERKLFVTGYEKAQIYFQDLLSKVKKLEDRITIYHLQITMLNMQHKITEALAVGKQALYELGINLPNRITLFHIVKLLIMVKWQTGSKPKFDNIKLTPVKDRRIALTIDIYQDLMQAAYSKNQITFSYIMLTIVNLMLKHGYTEQGIFAYFCYGSALLHGFNRYQEGLFFYELGHKLNELVALHSAQSHSNKIYFEYFMLGTHITVYRASYDQAIADLRNAYQYALESGNVDFSALSLLLEAYFIYVAGNKSLADVAQVINNLTVLQTRFKIRNYMHTITLFKYIIEYLQTSDAANQAPLAYLQEKFPLFTSIEQQEDKSEISIAYNMLVKFCYLTGSMQDMLLIAKKHQVYAKYLAKGGGGYVDNIFFLALIYTRAYQQTKIMRERRFYLHEIKSIQKDFKRWMQWYPANFKQYDLLLAAELANINNDTIDAISLYQEAIKSAQEHENLSILAVANECAGLFYLKIKQPKIGELFIRHAHYTYKRWGAHAKATLLFKEYSEWFTMDTQDVFISTKGSIVHTTLTGQTTTGSLDMLALFKSAQAISGEIRLDKLLHALLKVLLQSSGAQRGVLIVKEREAWLIKAEGKIDKQEIAIQLINEPLEQSKKIPISLLSYTIRTLEQLLIQNEKDLAPYLAKDNYLQSTKLQSLLVLPLLSQGELTSLLYLENNDTSYTFTPAHLQTLELLASQAAIALTNATLYHQATHDALTGLPNRTYLFQTFTRLSKRAAYNKVQIAILFLDLDGFKNINDTFGHEVGDKLLTYFANQLQIGLDVDDMAVRLGGDEFVILLDSITVERVQTFAQTLLNRLTKNITLDDNVIPVRTSIGISLFPQDGHSIQELLKNADTALYHVKQTGKGRYQLYNSSI